MLDTDSASYLLKNRAPAIEARLLDLPPSAVCVSAETRAELRYGFQRLPAEHVLHEAVRRLLELVRTLAWDADAADHYAAIRHRLTADGQPIGELDMMIAAHAMAAGATLVTNNVRHFGRVGAPLVVANWSDGG